MTFSKPHIERCLWAGEDALCGLYKDGKCRECNSLDVIWHYHYDSGKHTPLCGDIRCMLKANRHFFPRSFLEQELLAKTQGSHSSDEGP